MLKVSKKLWLPNGACIHVGAGSEGGGGADPAKVQGKLLQAGGTSSTTIAVTLDSPVGAGNLIVCALGFANDYVSVSMTDDKSNTYTNVNGGTGGNYSWLTFYRENVTNAPQTITATINVARSFRTLIVTEFSNVAASSPLDGSNINIAQAGSNTTDAITSGTATTTQNGNLVWGACVNLAGSSSLTKSSSFTQDQVVGQDFNTEYLIQPSAGSIAATWTGTTADQFSSAMMCFKRA